MLQIWNKDIYRALHETNLEVSIELITTSEYSLYTVSAFQKEKIF